jgi:hypothetical protein
MGAGAGIAGNPRTCAVKKMIHVVFLNNVRDLDSVRKGSDFEGVPKSFHVTNLILVFRTVARLVHLRSSSRCIGPVCGWCGRYCRCGIVRACRTELSTRVWKGSCNDRCHYRYWLIQIYPATPEPMNLRRGVVCAESIAASITRSS